jgi:EAL domain-containing protein (putative c-di-GMP-specific phosphodiesterase class I)
LADRTDLTAAMSQATDPMGLMQRVTDRTLELIEASTGVMVGLADEDGVTYVCGAGHRVSALGTLVGHGNSLSGVTVRTGTVQRADDTETDPRVDLEACRRLSVASLVCIPLTRGDETIGVLAVNSSIPRAFTDDDVATLTRLADFISVSIASACDIARVSSELLDIDTPGDASPGPAGTGADAEHHGHGRDRDRGRGGLAGPASETAAPAPDPASRYVMGVLSPEAAGRIDSGDRINHILEDPALLAMVFQPIVDLTDGRVAALEALARFDVTPYRTPDRWFAEAHQCGLGVELELLAVGRALDGLPEMPEGVAVTVNAGPEVVMADGFVDAFPEHVAERVILELTEHTAVDDYPELVSTLRILRRRGLRVAIDDTGSGYSSLAHILKLAPDFIKLDRELTSGVDLDPVRRALAASLVTFAGDTGADIIAEGVETKDELDILRLLGVRYVQGYHVGRPVPLDIAAHLAHRSAGA